MANRVPVAIAALISSAVLATACVRGPEKTIGTQFGEAPPEKQKKLSPQEAAKTCYSVAQSFAEEGFDQEAEIQYRLCLKSVPNYRDVNHRLALLYDRNGLDQQALEYYRYAMEQTPEDSALLNDFGYYYYRRNETNYAEQYFRRAVINDPSNKRAWNNLGIVLAEAGKSEESLGAFQQSVTEAEAYSNVGVILAQNGRVEEAKYYLQQALDREPTLPQTKAVLAWLEKTGGRLPSDQLVTN